MFSTINTVLTTLVLSALAAAGPLPGPEPQFSSGTPCADLPAGKYVCADNNWEIAVCNAQHKFELVAHCNNRSCAYIHGIPYCMQ